MHIFVFLKVPLSQANALIIVHVMNYEADQTSSSTFFILHQYHLLLKSAATVLSQGLRGAVA